MCIYFKVIWRSFTMLSKCAFWFASKCKLLTLASQERHFKRSPDSRQPADVRDMAKWEKKNIERKLIQISFYMTASLPYSTYSTLSLTLPLPLPLQKQANNKCFDQAHSMHTVVAMGGNTLKVIIIVFRKCICIQVSVSVCVCVCLHMQNRANVHGNYD